MDVFKKEFNQCLGLFCAQIFWIVKICMQANTFFWQLKLVVEPLIAF
jgi:hypothetical protein